MGFCVCVCEGGGGGKGYIAPPLSNLPSLPPSSYTYATADAKGSATALPELRSSELKTQLHMHILISEVQIGDVLQEQHLFLRQNKNAFSQF